MYDDDSNSYDNDNSMNGQNSSTGSFDIRDHLDKLERGKG